jgi:hypothetical protein
MMLMVTAMAEVMLVMLNMVVMALMTAQATTELVLALGIMAFVAMAMATVIICCANADVWRL